MALLIVDCHRFRIDGQKNLQKNLQILRKISTIEQMILPIFEKKAWVRIPGIQSYREETPVVRMSGPYDVDK